MSIPPLPPGPPDSGGDFLPGTPVTPDDSTQMLSQDDLAELRRRAARKGPATPIGDESPAESTQMLSIAELRQLAAETHNDQIDGLAQARPASGSSSRGEIRAAEEYAQRRAAPGQWPLSGTSPGPPAQPRGAWSGGPVPPAPPAHAPGAARAYSNGGAPDPRPGYVPGGVPGDRKKGSRAWIWLLAVIGVLILLGLVALGTWFVADREPTSNPGTLRPPPPASDTAAPSTPADGVRAFASPSGNITCTIDAERVRCAIGQRDYDAPGRPAACDWDGWGSVVVLNEEGAGFSCEPEGPAAPAPAALNYGETIEQGTMRCTSGRSGMECFAGEKSFELSREAATIEQ